MKQEFPKGEIKSIRGRSFVIKGDDIDTDRIIPARFLKCVNFAALGEQVFADDRKELNGNHPFDLDHNKGANILVVNDNFGCGSSREHAPQALMRWGIRLIIGESFAEIFFGNAINLGMPCVSMSDSCRRSLANLLSGRPKSPVTIDVKELQVRVEGDSFPVELRAGARDSLLNGAWDPLDELLGKTDRVDKLAASLHYI